MCNFRCHLTRLLLVCAAVLTGCGGGGDGVTPPPPDDNNPPPPDDNNPQHPFNNPTGTTFTLPSGISFVGPVATNIEAEPCGEILGVASDLVNVCVTLHNATGTDTVVVFPAGLILDSQDTTVQSGTQVQEQRVLVRAGSDTTFYWTLWCIHADLAASSSGDLYVVGPISNHAGLREIISLVAGKNLSASIFLVQTAIWEVSDGEGLSPSTRAALQALPSGGVENASRYQGRSALPPQRAGAPGLKKAMREVAGF